MIIRFSDQNPFLSKDLTPIVIFALNNQNNLFGFAEEISRKYFPEISSIGTNESRIKKVIEEDEHGLESIKGNPLTLIGIKCYDMGVGWGGTLPLVANFIHNSEYKEPVSFVWPKEVHLLGIPDNQKAIERYLSDDFASKKKVYPMIEAGVPIFFFKV